MQAMRTGGLRFFDRLDRAIARAWLGRFKQPNFVILSAPRSGSNLLVEMLNFHPDIICHNEVFSPKGIYSAHWVPTLGRSSWLSLGMRNRLPRAYLGMVWGTAPRSKLVGFKLFDHQSKAVRDVVLRRPRTKKILLFRRNFLRAELSRQIALATDVWIQLSGEASRSVARFDLETFWSRYAAVQAEERSLESTLAASGHAYMKIHYEDIAGSSAPAPLDRIFAFLGVGPCSFDRAALTIRRQNPFPMRELMTNYGEVEAALAGTECEWMLRDE